MSKQKNDKVKQVSFSQVEKIIKNNTPTLRTIEVTLNKEEGVIPVSVKHKISIAELVGLVNRVANSCFVTIEDDETGESKVHFAPYYKPFFFKKNILDYYTSFKSDDNLERAYDLVTYSAVADYIMTIIDEVQLEEIKTSIDELIEFKKQELLANKPSRLDNLIDNINDIVLKIGEKIDGFDMDEMSKHIPAISEAFSGGEFNAEKIAKAFVDLRASEIDDGENKDSETDNVTENKIVPIDFSKDTE